MSFYEMTITLEDVSYLIHLLIMGDFWDPTPGITREGFVTLSFDMLEVSFKETTVKARACMSACNKSLIGCTPYLRVIKLLIYFECDAKAYMMMLVGYTILSTRLLLFSRQDICYYIEIWLDVVHIVKGICVGHTI